MKILKISVAILLMTMLFVPVCFSAGEKEDTEAKVLQLPWLQGAGTDIFQSPWFDYQCLYPFLLFQKLMVCDDDYNPNVPQLAESMTLSDDKLTYSFKIRRGVKWHDGVDFTIDDIVFSMKAFILCPETADKSNLLNVVGAQDFADGKASNISGITVSGDTISFKLIKPDSLFMNNVITQIFIFPEHILGNVDPLEVHKYEPFWSHPIGTGPYKITNITFPDYFEMTRYKDFKGEKYKIKNILFTSYTEGWEQAVYAAGIAGNCYYFLCREVAEANNITKNNPDMKALYSAGTYNRYFMVNQNSSKDGKLNPDIFKKEVRQAISLAIDKVGIAENLYLGQAKPSTSHVSINSPYFSNNLRPPVRDIEKAKKLLKDADFDFSRPIRICYYYKDQTALDVIATITSNLNDVGIKVESFLADGDLVSILYEVRNYELLLAATGSRPDPIIQYTHLTVPDGAMYDKIYGAVEERRLLFEDLVNSYLDTYDPAQKKVIGDKIQNIACDYLNTIPLYSMDLLYVYNKAHLSIDESVFKTELGCKDLKIYNWYLK